MIATMAQEYQRCPLAPVPALRRCQAVRASEHAGSSTRPSPAPVVTVRLDPMPST
ncbi:MAG: hypothetical protein ACRDTS_15420 [Mycobacterium sp.]